MKPLLSVIIPVYNVEHYLKKCINSVVNQEFSDYEIIIIDDGSTDLSGAIADNLEKKYSNIKTFHKKNGGLSDARNCGIKKALGDYITFVDSDDTINPMYLQVLYNAFQRNKDVDISIIRYLNIYPHNQNNSDSSINKKNKYRLLTNEEATEKMLLQKGYDVSAWAKMYKKELFKDNLFKENIVSEDYQLIPKIFLQAKKVAYNNFIGYYYLQREGSIMNSTFSVNSLSIIETAREIYTLSLTKNRRLQVAASSKAISALIEQYSLLNKCKSLPIYEQAEELLRDNIDMYLKNITVFGSAKLKVKVFKVLQKILGKVAYKMLTK
ncbi:glycosyltransferase family 2 protein [Leuconostoc mesenteroides]|uniref:GT n=1 Tax=Leuconostoc mesenteroides TaxID=1245 RepID=A0A7S7A9S4_LEUME|nr:glycosyltransferase family 2 protein [Leuconostoc mesenteroides]MBZ1503433.1 glycosyltransferase family 2 protein [Leuconostoc mesenteroides]QOW37955.1 GT [Leuconostoc mesenteroides]